MPANRIRTLIVDDSALMRKLITDLISADTSIEIIGTAKDGKVGSDMALELKPDVVITDMVMPEFDGMYLVKSVMDKRPMPIIVLSSLDKTNSRIFDALQYGAFEFIDKPNGADGRNAFNDPLIKLIREASLTDTNLLKARQLTHKNTHTHTFTQQLNYDIVVIGASTGGPGAVELIINNLPRNLQVPVVIGQHMPPRFLETFSERLNENSPLPVKLARRGEVLKAGVIYVANGESNTCVEKNMITGAPMITSTSRKFEEFNFPSIDCLFESVADTYAERSIGVILTGMGKDGMLGLSKIKSKGGYTIAQDEESSVVYGMPKAAYEFGAVKQIVPLTQISGFIVSCL